MLQEIKNGWALFKASTKTFVKLPVFLIPILAVWLVYAPATIYFEWYFPWDDYYYAGDKLPVIFLICFGFSLLLTISCAVLLGLIQERETGKKFNLLTVLRDALAKHIIPILVLSFVWAVIWFILTILEAIFRSSSKKRSKGENISTGNIARTLAGNDGSITFSAIEKGVRMAVFLIMPAFIWEHHSIRESFRRGMSILKQREIEFITGFTLTALASIVVFLPPAIMFKLDDLGVNFPDAAWFVCIIYIAFGWSYSIYLEQMFAAELYLWQMRWEKEVRKAEANKITPPQFNEIPKPSILDDISDLLGNEQQTVSYE